MPPPEYGSGPVNYSNQGGQDPFSAFDNRINYNDMVRRQMVSQYQQSVVRPATMTLAQARSVATDPRFQYGVNGGQDARMYERQAAASRGAFGASVGGAMADVAGFGGASVLAGLAGYGAMASMVPVMAATLVPMHFINKGIDNSLSRRKYMHSIASDVEQYRDRLGFSGGLSYKQATELGRNMESSMSSPGQFFSREQQSNIHKIGLSNDLLSAKSKGMDSGTIKQYEKNVRELIDTTEAVVKLLQTTTEGGMSVIKELKQKGFGSMRAIKDQVLQAKSYGGLTGMGAQNMMQVGAAGAQAVQGTPWSASAGAGMYQYGAAQAHMIAQGSSSAAYAVQRVGGTAAAGAVIGNFAMNMMQSGIGTKLAAYAMKSDGSVDQSKMDRMLSGKAGAYEIVTGANQAGYGMGGNRVRFDMFKEDMLNNMSSANQMRMVNSGFSAWAKQRPGASAENLAYAFSGEFTDNKRAQRLMYERLMNNNNLSQIEASKQVSLLTQQQYASSRQLGAAGKQAAGVWKGFTGALMDFGGGIADASTGAMNWASSAWSTTKTGLSDSFGDAMVSTGMWKSGINRAKYGSVEDAANRAYGLFSTTNQQKKDFTEATLYERNNAAPSVRPKKGVTFNLLDAISKHGKENVQYAVQKLWQTQMNSNTAEAFKDQGVSNIVGYSSKDVGSESAGFNAALLQEVKRQKAGIAKQHTDAQSAYDKMFNAAKPMEQELYIRQLDQARRSAAHNGGVPSFSNNVGMGELKVEQRYTNGGRDVKDVWAASDSTNQKIKDLVQAEANKRKTYGVTPGPGGGTIDLGAAKKAEEAAIDNLYRRPEAEYREKSVFNEINAKSDQFPDVGVLDAERQAKWDKASAGLKKLGIDVSTKAGRSKFNEQMISYDDRATSKDTNTSLTDAERQKYNLGTKLINLNGGMDALDATRGLGKSRGIAEERQRRQGMVTSAAAMLDGNEWGDGKSAEKFEELYGRSMGLGKALNKNERLNFIKTYESELSGITGNTGVVMRSHAKSAEDFSNYMSTSKKQKEKGTPTGDITKLFEDLRSLKNIAREGEGSAKEIILSGKTTVVDKGEDESKKDYRINKYVDMKKDDIAEKVAKNAIAGHNENSQGNTSSAEVRPPVLNYWNNQWTI